MFNGGLNGDGFFNEEYSDGGFEYGEDRQQEKVQEEDERPGPMGRNGGDD